MQITQEDGEEALDQNDNQTALALKHCSVLATWAMDARLRVVMGDMGSAHNGLYSDDHIALRNGETDDERRRRS